MDPKLGQTQTYLDKIAYWTSEKEMKLNCEKTKFMIFNPSKKYKFNTRLMVENEKIEQVHETKLLGVVIRDDFSFKSNTELIIGVSNSSSNSMPDKVSSLSIGNVSYSSPE